MFIWNNPALVQPGAADHDRPSKPADRVAVEFPGLSLGYEGGGAPSAKVVYSR